MMNSLYASINYINSDVLDILLKFQTVEIHKFAYLYNPKVNAVQILFKKNFWVRYAI